MPRPIAGNLDAAHERSVFLNVPFDRLYEPLFIALVAGLTSLGLKPRCVLEIVERGEGRFQRIVRLLRSCRASIHDLSRVQPSLINRRRIPRFNMPFELGQAMMLRAFQPHDVHVLESERHRLALSLSDLGGVDPLIHENKPTVVLRRLLGAIDRPGRQPSLAELENVRAELSTVVRQYKRQYATESIFAADGFRILTSAAGDSAAELGLIAR